jgi:tRNA (guanine-N7-)-methyltransferase
LRPNESLNFDTIFGRSAPRVLEIGFGDGASLLEMAKASPEKDFIAVEVFRRGIARLLMGIVQHSLHNIRVICQDAVEVVKQHIPDKSLHAVQIYFADPWPKTRHHKRRLVKEEFTQILTKKLVPGGRIHCATDWEHYAHQMMSVFSDNSELRNTASHSQFIERPTFRPFTKYEKRAEKVGRSIFDLIFERI